MKKKDKINQDKLITLGFDVIGRLQDQADINNIPVKTYIERICIIQSLNAAIVLPSIKQEEEQL